MGRRRERRRERRRGVQRGGSREKGRGEEESGKRRKRRELILKHHALSDKTFGKPVGHQLYLYPYSLQALSFGCLLEHR